MTSDAVPGPASADGQLTGSPLWLDLGDEQVFTLLHTPPPGERLPLAALILPTFGMDNECSYRSRRHWATRLAQAGITAARIDFPGSENSSGSPLDPGRVDAWVRATARCAQWLRATAQAQRVVVIGIGLGGLIAYKATAAGAAIDDLILWGVPAGGRAYVREQRAFSRVIAAGVSEPPEPPRADGALGLVGYLMSAETAAAISAIKLTELPLPAAPLRHVLLIGRGAHGVDDRLKRQLEHSGATLTVLEADDYHRLMAPAELDMTPWATISASVAWLEELAGHRLEAVAHAPGPPLPVARESVELEVSGVAIQEHALELQTSGGRLVGVISEPIADAAERPCLVVLNCAAMRNTSPSRLFVEISRRVAASGMPVARFDLPGLGDSDGTAVSVLERTLEHDAGPMAALTQIYDQLQRRGVADRFVPTGLCLGAYLTVRAVLADRRSVAAIALNAPAFTWTELQTRRVLRDHAAFVGSELTEARLANEPSPAPLRALSERLAQARRLAEARAARHLAGLGPLWRWYYRTAISDVRRDLDELGATGAQLRLVHSQDEMMFRALELPALARQLRRWPNISVETLPTRDHVLRPLAIQELVVERVTAALCELGSRRDSPGGTPLAADAAGRGSEQRVTEEV